MGFVIDGNERGARHIREERVVAALQEVQSQMKGYEEAATALEVMDETKVVAQFFQGKVDGMKAAVRIVSETLTSAREIEEIECGSCGMVYRMQENINILCQTKQCGECGSVDMAYYTMREGM